MKFPVLASILTATLLGVAFLAIAQDSEKPNAKVLYRRSGVEGTISGVVDFVGEAPARKMIDMSADPFCVATSSYPFTEDIIVNNGKFANVVVYIKSGSPLERYSFDEPEATAYLAHRACRYEPHVLAIRVGQRLEVSSNDATQHNTHPLTQLNPEWNQTQPPGGQPLLKKFDRAETFIPLKDNQHPWERAWLGVFSHPFFAITDERGRYRIEGLPPGSYTLVAWHERLGEKTTEITIGGSESKNVDFTFKPSAQKP